MVLPGVPRELNPHKGSKAQSRLYLIVLPHETLTQWPCLAEKTGTIRCAGLPPCTNPVALGPALRWLHLSCIEHH